jgi:hypothetical protein
MASHITVAPGFRFSKFNGEHPVNFSVGYLTPDMLFLVSGMHLVAGLTASPFLTVYMEKVEIHVPIAKISKRLCGFFSGNLFVMASKTHGIVFNLVRKIKIVRKKLHQVLGVICCMGVMTCAAITFGNRSVEILAGGYLLFHLFMAGKAKILSIFSEALAVVGRVGKVAPKTPVSFNGAVLGLRAVHLLNKFLVALTAQGRPVILEVESVLRAVGGVTLFTGFFYRLVNILQAEVLFFILVAAKTEGYTIHGQKEFTLRGMGIVADDTITPCHRTVHIILCGHIIFMAGKTDICQFFLGEKKFSLRLVGVMADYTFFFYR